MTQTLAQELEELRQKAISKDDKALGFECYQTQLDEEGFYVAVTRYALEKLFACFPTPPEAT